MTSPGSLLYQQAQERHARAAAALAAAQVEYHEATTALLFAQRLQLRDDTTAVVANAQLTLEGRLEALECRLSPATSTT